MAVSKEAVMANTMEAILQYVEGEAAYEFGDRDVHDFVLMTAARLRRKLRAGDPNSPRLASLSSRRNCLLSAR